MEILKYKKIGKNKYKISFDTVELTVYEDIIFKYDLLLKKDIDISILDKIVDDNKYYEAYYMSLSYIEIKMRNKKEIIDYLKRKEFDEKYIDFAIQKLNDMNLLNNKSYIEAYVNDKVNLTLDGPYKIKRNLVSYDFDEEVIDEYLSKFDNELWLDRIRKVIEKKKVLLKNKSYYSLINKLRNDLYNLGYDKYLIDEELSKIEYDNSSIEKEYQKALKKYKDNKVKISSYLLRKGYSYDEINNINI